MRFFEFDLAFQDSSCAAAVERKLSSNRKGREGKEKSENESK